MMGCGWWLTRAMSSSMSSHHKKIERLRNTLQPLLALAAHQGVDRMPETVRRQCLELLTELLVAIVRAESNPTDSSDL
jgi:hypothetical protein